MRMDLVRIFSQNTEGKTGFLSILGFFSLSALMKSQFLINILEFVWRCGHL